MNKGAGTKMHKCLVGYPFVSILKSSKLIPSHYKRLHSTTQNIKFKAVNYVKLGFYYQPWSTAWELSNHLFNKAYTLDQIYIDQSSDGYSIN